MADCALGPVAILHDFFSQCRVEDSIRQASIKGTSPLLQNEFIQAEQAHRFQSISTVLPFFITVLFEAID